MDKKVLRERMRKKKRQMMIRHYTKLATYAIAAVLGVIFIIRGVILPIAHRVMGSNTGENTPVQAETIPVDTNAAMRQPLKGESDSGKVTAMTPGWHEDGNGRWYQNADGTYFAGGLQTIDGVKYCFNDNGYLQTGWVTKGVNDYYFNEDGSYNEEKKRPMLALTFDDGPGQYTMELLQCLEENNAHATFFMQGINVGYYPEAPKKMLEIGCEIGNHSWDHPNLFNLDLDSVAKQFADTDNALIEACGQAATVARAPFGNGNSDIFNTVQKPFFMWSLDTMDWSLLDADADYNAVMNGDLTDGSIILMHDIHEPSFQAALRIIPDLVAQGYKLVTVSEMAAAKGVTLQYASYSDFWQSSLDNGLVTGYNGGSDAQAPDDGSGEGEISDGEDGSGEGEISDGDDGSDEGEISDGDDSGEFDDDSGE